MVHYHRRLEFCAREAGQNSRIKTTINFLLKSTYKKNENIFAYYYPTRGGLHIDPLGSSPWCCTLLDCNVLYLHLIHCICVYICTFYLSIKLKALAVPINVLFPTQQTLRHSALSPGSLSLELY